MEPREAAVHPYAQQDWYHGGHLQGGRTLYLPMDERRRVGTTQDVFHVGSKESATQRIDPAQWDIEEFPEIRHAHLYRMRLAPGARVCPHLHDDEGDAGSLDFQLHDPEKYDVHAYRNSHEDKGSISLVGKSHVFRVAEDLGRHPRWSDPNFSAEMNRREREGREWDRQHQASLIDEYRAERDAQDRRYERSGVGWGKNTQEYRDYFGVGDSSGPAREKRLTLRDWLRNNRGQREEDMLPEDHANWRGYQLGRAHSRAGRIDVEEVERESARSSHPEHFQRGYQEGWDEVPERIAVLTNPQDTLDGTYFVRVAHVSGNTIDAIHCPFCGSGSVVARSDGSIECGFCTAAYTVQVAPQFSAFPMTADGMPYPWPGRPDGGMPVPGAEDAQGAIPGAGGPIVGGEQDQGEQGPPWAEDGEDEDEDAEPGGADDETAEQGLPTDQENNLNDQDEAEIRGAKTPPFPPKDKKTKKKSYLIGTTSVPAEEYMRHLAIKTAHNPEAMATLVRVSR